MEDRPTPPARTPAQRNDALEQANATRSKRAADKRKIAGRNLDARGILAEPPAHWARAKVADLLHALPGVGETKVERILLRTCISPSRTLAGMTPEQSQRLAEAIARYCPAEQAVPAGAL